MAEGKRIYEIRINGLQESYEGVKSLREALDTLSDTVVNVTKEEEKTEKTKKATTAATDALSKAQEKLNNWDKEYQVELAKTNAELSNNKKEINATIKVQQAQEVVDAKQLDTYAQKQQYLSALNTLIRNHSTATEEDRAAIDRMVQESAALQAELKATDAQMKIYTRNVGNYPGAAQMVVDSHKSLKQELRELKAEMAEMLANGVSKTDEAYLKLAERAGQLKDAMSDANQDITNFASDTRGLTNAINLATSAVNVYQLYNSALQVFGNENEDAAKAMQKMMAVMTLLNSLQQVQNSLLSNGSATARLYTKSVELIQAALGLKKTATEADIATTEASTVAQETNTVAQEANAVANEANAASTGTATSAEAANTGAVTANTTATNANTVATNSMSAAQKAGAVASKTLSVALRAIPLMAVIGLVMALIQNWESIWNWFKKTFPVLDTLSKKFNKFGGFMKTVKAIAKGLGEGIINWLVNPFKTLSNVISKVLSGDFAGAAQAAIDGIKQQFTGFSDGIRKELNGAAQDAIEETAKKRMEKEHEATEYQLKELEARYGNEAKYSKEGIKLQQKEFDQRKALAKGNAEELKKIHLEEVSFQRECEEYKTREAEKGARARTEAAKKAAAEAKRAAEEAQRAEEKLRKEREKLISDTETAIKELDKLSNATEEKVVKLKDKRYSEMTKQYAEYNKMFGKAIVDMELWTMASENALDKLQIMWETALESGSDLEQELVARMMRQASTEYAYATDKVKEYEKGIQDTIEQADHFVARRREIAINQIAIDAQKLKESYEADIAKLKSYVQQLEEQKKTATGKMLENIEDKIGKANKAIERAEKAMSNELGKYSKTEIKIPVELNFDQLKQNFNAFKELNGDIAFTFQDVIDAVTGVDGTLEKLYKRAKNPEEIFTTFRDLANVLGLTKDKTEEEIAAMKEMFERFADDRPFEQKKAEIHDFFNTASIDISKFGTYSQVALDKFKEVDKETMKTFDDVFKAFAAQQDKVISFSEKSINRFRDATRDIKFEPVMEDDKLSKFFDGQILNVDKTRERYSKLKTSYTEYLETIQVGSESMQKYEEAWQQKLQATENHVNLIKRVYGESSTEYKNAVMEYELLTKDKEKADAAYAIEREKVSKQIEEIQKKENSVMQDYYQSLHDRMSSVYSTLSENVFQPLADGFGALLDFQLEQAQEALEEITELYDKAVEAREESASRMQEINNELKNSDGQNKEALEQRLAEEQVLLVQREETERALQKEKEKREYEVSVAEARQRKFELGQKLIEGLVNTALGVTAALKYGFPMGPIFGSIIAAFGALQTAIIAKQIGNVKMPQKYASGGLIGEHGISRSHSQGGHRIEGTNIEVEGQEWVINKKSSKKYDTLLRAINEDRPGLVQKQVEIIRERKVINNNVTKFASGGQINTLAATRAVEDNNQIQAITDLIRQIDFQPTVSVTDINKVNKNLVKVRQYAGSVA